MGDTRWAGAGEGTGHGGRARGGAARTERRSEPQRNIKPYLSPPRPDVLVAVCLSSRCSRFAFYRTKSYARHTPHRPRSTLHTRTARARTQPASHITEPERCLRVRTQVPVSPTASTASETGHPSPLLPTDRAIARNGCTAAQTDTLPANQRTLFLLCHKRYHKTHAAAQSEPIQRPWRPNANAALHSHVPVAGVLPPLPPLRVLITSAASGETNLRWRVMSCTCFFVTPTSCLTFP
jgi:hypothetical protein